MTIHTTTAGEALIVFNSVEETEQFIENVKSARAGWQGLPDAERVGKPILMNLRFLPQEAPANAG